MDGLEKGIAKKMEKIGHIYMGALGIISAGRGVVDALSAFTAPAAELENVATSLWVVMGNAEVAERLTGNLRRHWPRWVLNRGTRLRLTATAWQVPALG